MSEELYYLRNVERGVVGNCCQWWKDDDRGYTIDIRRAKKFTASETDEHLFYEQGGMKIPRRKFKKHPVGAIDCLVQHHIDIQDLNRKQTKPWTMP